jgi:aspartate-semialdehyde dehydrogenase
MGKEYIVEELTHETPKKGFTYALFSAGADISREYCYEFVNNGTIIIDNSSAFRMDENIPLVVPEVNIHDAYNASIIANPNCSTIQAVVALKPLHDKYILKRVIYSTYQAVSGAGKKGIDDLINTSYGRNSEKFPYKIYNNCIPQIDDFADSGYTKEELKMINETRKILKCQNLKITSTCVRVPVMNCHSESVNLEFEKDFDIDELKQILSKSPGIVMLDDINFKINPLNTFANNKDEVFVGRVRRDLSIQSGINIWIVADNIRKGAASNAVQILEKLIERRLGN